MTNKHKSPAVSVSFVLAAIAILLFAVSFIVGPELVWRASLGLVVLALILPHTKIIELALRLLWLVRIEPPATDLLMAMGIAKAALLGKRVNRVKVGHPVWFLVVFVLLSVLQIVWSPDIPRAVFYAAITAYTMLVLPMVFWQVNRFFKDENWKEALIFAIDLTAIALLIAGIAAMVGLAGHFPWLYHTQSRGRAFFKDVNVAGPFVVFGALQLLTWMMVAGRFSVATVSRLAVYTAAIAFTFSRGALLNYIVGILVIGAVTVIRKRGWRFTLFILLSIGFGIYFFPNLINVFGQQRVASINTYDTEGRFAAWKSGFLMFVEQPWGIGPGQFEVVSPDYQRRYIGNADITPSAHNMYIRMLAENGVVGIVLYITAVLGVLLGLVRVMKASATGSTCFINATWLLAVLMGILAEGAVIDVLHWRHFGIALGLSLYYVGVCRAKGGGVRV